MPPANDDYRKRLAARNRLLSRASQKQKREKAFSTPAPARFGVEIDTKQDRVTDFGKPFEAPLLTNNETAKTIDRFVGQMARRYTINIPKGARDVAVDTVTGGEYAFKQPPLIMNLLYPAGITGSNAILYNLFTNEKFSDALAPFDFAGVGGVARAVGKAAVSKGGKALLGAIGAGLGFGAANEDEAEAAGLGAVPGTVGRAMTPQLKSIIDEGTRRALINIGLGRYNLGTNPIIDFIKGMNPTASLEDTINIAQVAAQRAKTINSSAKKRLEETDNFYLPYVPLTRVDVEELAANTLFSNPNVNPLFLRTTHGSHNPYSLLEGGHTPQTVDIDPGIYNLLLGDVPDIIGRGLLADTLAGMRGKRVPTKAITQETLELLGLMHRLSKGRF